MQILRRFSVGPSLAFGVLLAAVVPAAADNFLIIVGDDLGVDKIGAYGEGPNPPPTPTIDSLAVEGVLFRNAYAYPNCSPARAAALTGRFGFRTGIGTPGGANLALEEVLLPELVAATHESAALGKWHIGANGDADHPNDSGFDYFAGALANIGDYFSWNKTTQGSTVNGWSVYATTDNVDEAIAAIAGFGSDPWLVWLAFNAPHRPRHAPPSGLHGYSLSGNPQAAPVEHYGAMVEAMDTEIDRLLHSIHQAVLDQTTIIFFGDNGTPRPVVEPPFISNRAKGSVYEGGINVPFIVKSPYVDPADQGSESLALVGVTDIFATVAEIAGTTSNAQDSVSLLPYLLDPSLPTQPRRPYAYSESFSPNGFGPYNENERAIREDTYKLIWRDGVYEELFHLNDDPFEQNNLLDAPLDPEAQEAYDRLVSWMEGLHAPLVPSGSVWSASVLVGLLLASARRAFQRR